MEVVVVFVLFIVNFGISWFNAWSCGRSWADTKAIGGWPRFMAWCGATMSGVGFTWCYLIVLALGAGAGGWLTPDQVQAALELGYVIIIIPCLGSGMCIWLDSVTTAWRRRDFASVGVASWNTFAQAHNTYEAAKTLPGIFDHLGKALGKGKGGKDKGALLVLLLVVIALASGGLTTAAIIRHTAREYARRIRDDEMTDLRQRKTA